MKRSLLTLVFATFLFAFAMAQASDQNPRAREAYLSYERQVDTLHAATMGATIDMTYEAYDPILIKEQRREDRREFRRQLRLERARRPVIRGGGWGNPYGYNPYWW